MNRENETNMVTQYLADAFGCTIDDLHQAGVVYTVNKQVTDSYLKILTYKESIVVQVSENMHLQVKQLFQDKNRDEIFECPLVYGQTIHYIPDLSLAREPELPTDFTYELLEGEGISKLSAIKGFDNSLVFDEEGKTSTQIVFVARKGASVVGVAGAGAVTDRMWEVGIDVVSECRNNGLGSLLVRKLTMEILKKDIVPFYSASVTNIGSQMVASRAGYIPCWMDTFGNIFDDYYSYDYGEILPGMHRIT